MKHLLTFGLLLIGFVSFAQADSKALWRDYLSYTRANDVLKIGDKLFVSTEKNIFSYDKEDFSLERLSKTNLLADINVSAIAYSPYSNALIVGYNSGLIDVINLSNNTSFSLKDFERSSIIGNKKINEIYSHNESLYLSTGLGVIKINMNKWEVSDTYIIGVTGNQLNINSLRIYKDKIYAATDEGIKEAPVNHPFLSDFNNWDLVSLPNGQGEYLQTVVYSNRLLATYILNDQNKGDTLYSFDGSQWSKFSSRAGAKIQKIKTNDNILTITNHVWSDAYDLGLNKLSETQGGPFKSSLYDNKEKTLWAITNIKDGLIKIDENKNINKYSPESPFYSDSYNLSKIVDDHIWLTSGRLANAKGIEQYNPNGVFHFDQKTWAHYNKEFTTILNQPKSTEYIYVSADPKDPNHAYFSNYRSFGLLEVNNGSLTQYNNTNSSLQLTDDGENYNLGDVQFDKDGNVWVANSRVLNPLSVKSNSGVWKSFYCGGGLLSARFSEVLIDTRNYKWMISPNGYGAIIYNDMNTPLEDSDDEYKRLTSTIGEGGLPNERVWSIAEDLEGQIWLGTEEGIAVVYNPSALFDGGDYDAKEILIEQDGNIEILLGAERITALVVDGANRKWVGTFNSGVYCFSPDGLEQIHHFTAENSPLFSNTISDIQINHRTGEVLIATEEGLLSYKSDATLGAEDYSDIYPYPNPVRETYSGNIFINGLLRDSDVKITDTEGNLVYETTSLGGQAVWDGNDKFGNRVTTGVYLVFVAAPDGSLAEVTKLLFVK